MKFRAIVQLTVAGLSPPPAYAHFSFDTYRIVDVFRQPWYLGLLQGFVVQQASNISLHFTSNAKHSAGKQSVGKNGKGAK